MLDARSGAVQEKFWGLAVLSQGIEVARAGVEEGVGGGGGGGEDHDVDD